MLKNIHRFMFTIRLKFNDLYKIPVALYDNQSFKGYKTITCNANLWHYT